MNRNTYIFDFDGTLADSMPTWSGKMLNILRECGVEYPPDVIKIITPLGDRGTAEYFRDGLGVSLGLEEMFAKMDAFALPKYRDEIKLKPGVFEYLQMLKREGCSLHVLTASPHKMVDPCLARNRVFDLFDNVWSCDDFGKPKSDPQIYLDAVAQIGTTVSDAVFFDDNLHAVKTAASAGLFTVGVYDPSAETFTEELKQVSDLYLESFVGAKPF